MSINKLEKEIANQNELLLDLINSKRVKYSDWSNIDINLLNKSAGVYHFFEANSDDFTSLYVGKAGFGSKNEWSLYERLKQHFQPSQKYALLGKASKKMNIPPIDIHADFCKRTVYLQWKILSDSTTDTTMLEKELMRFEYFAISILNPEYTDA